ncbi:MAG: hypothetical protein U9Q08_04620 [Candidatus Omnitrophota bacterium]|nr:hypothetical protein [Candidatus Omnitrophota bacterium]
MKTNENKRKNFFIANKLHKEILIIVFVSMLLPVILVGITLHSLIFNIAAWEIGIPEAVFSVLLPAIKQVNFIVFIALPFVMLLLWFWALMATKRIVGPFDRLCREVDQRVKGTKTGRIQLRKGDALQELVDGFNRLLDKSS